MKKYLLPVFVIIACKAASPTAPRFADHDQWLGIYLGGSKIGYSFESIRCSPDRCRLENRTSMRIGAM